MFSNLFNTKAKENLSEIEHAIRVKELMLKTLETNIEVATRKLADLRSEVTEEEQKQHLAKYERLGSYSASVDWKAMDAFSIERAYCKTVEGVPVTIIGYRSGNNIREWILFTDKANHEKLVTEFNEYVKTKNNI